MRPSTCAGSAPRRAISGTGQAGRRWIRRAARRRPWAGAAWWKTSHTCPVKVGDVDTDVCLICHEGLTESFLLTLREPITRGAQKKPDLIEGITLACAVTGRVLLDAAAHLTWSVASELDDMEGIEDAGGVLELIVDGVLAVPGRGPAPWGDPPLEWSTMPVSAHGGPGGVGPGDATRAHQPPAPEPLRSGRGRQMRLADTT